MITPLLQYVQHHFSNVPFVLFVLFTLEANDTYTGYLWHLYLKLVRMLVQMKLDQMRLVQTVKFTHNSSFSRIIIKKEECVLGAIQHLILHLKSVGLFNNLVASSYTLSRV